MTEVFLSHFRGTSCVLFLLLLFFLAQNFNHNTDVTGTQGAFPPYILLLHIKIVYFNYLQVCFGGQLTNGKNRKKNYFLLQLSPTLGHFQTDQTV